ncbi:nacht and ankyrin domain protein [Colletotrichum incanum]|uniref:Nacht and ankyrin domain protein n=1 Tax=Colletotrichum incanum TaxID=1573173 RepID=A0A162PPX5_COLIC|nr:nacht and ankyrin domain protein [Colletotrichum incanum]OHW98843.1 NACHT and ankyrin domain protein [Colletotrichum incanum]
MGAFSSVLDAPSTNESFNHGLATFTLNLAALSVPFLLTYVFTYTRFVFQNWSRRSSEGRSSPVPPYIVPGLGHAYSILFNAEKLLRPLQTKFQSSIFRLSLPVGSLLYVLPGEGVRSLLRASRDFVPVPGLFDGLTVFFGLTPADYHIFNHDHISAFESTKGKEHSTSHPDESRRIMEHQRKDFTTFLTGENLRLVMERFSCNLRELIYPYHFIHSDPESVVIPDLYTFVRDAIFKAEVEALYGKHIFTICPSFGKDFWAFYDAFPVVSRGSPRWLYPAQYRSRDQMLRNFNIWRKWCKSNSYRDNEEPGNAESDPIWGTRYVRNMVRRYEGLEFSETGVSALMLGFLFVTTANTIPATAWMALHIFLDQTLVSRLRRELLITSETTESQNDSIALSSAPLLNSVYRETLRLHVAGTIGRKAVDAGVRLHGDSLSALKSGVTGMSSSWLGGLNESVWNTGKIINGVAEYSLESFWAERFLEYPGDPWSGPLRKPTVCYEGTTGAVQEKPVREDSKARLSNPAGLRGYFFPFGGGAWRCPGETLAKNTILVSAFLLLKELDVEILDPLNAAKASSRHRTMPFGTHAFDRPVPARYQKRQCHYVV